jgi:predicted RNA-binding Zn ribbon-like protein
MTWPASERYGTELGPDGLGFVQDLLNTVPAGVEDLLSETGSAQSWLDRALTQWAGSTGRTAERIDLTEADVAGLRNLRDELQQFIRGTATLSLASPAGMQIDPDGQVRVDPRGNGWRRIGSIVLIEILEAQRADRWRRVKLCRNPRCSASFYDRSRNNSGVWHNVQICGNAANLRAYRARQKVT